MGKRRRSVKAKHCQFIMIGTKPGSVSCCLLPPEPTDQPLEVCPSHAAEMQRNDGANFMTNMDAMTRWIKYKRRIYEENHHD